MPKYQAGRGGCASAYHVLVAAANIGSYYFNDNPVMTLPVTDGQFWIIYFAYFNLTGFYIRNSVVLTHNILI
jgi:hypothetical protein